MKFNNVKLEKCDLNLGEIQGPLDFGYFSPVFHCTDAGGGKFSARMRLHITEPLDGIVFADPRSFKDGGMEVNSSGSRALRRKASYADSAEGDPVISEKELKSAPLYRLDEGQIKSALLAGYDFASAGAARLEKKIPEVAFTCHDPNVIGGGNTILFRLINWLSELGVKVTVYSCGSAYPVWTRVNAEFKKFRTYAEMCAAIKEDVVILYTMWHIAPMLAAGAKGKSVYHFRQTLEAFNYGTDAASMFVRKPVIDLLESLPLGVITVSPHLREWYCSRVKDVFYLPNGVDLKTYYPRGEKPSEREKTVVSVGHPLYFLKGGDVLARALKQLVSRNPGIKIRWRVATGIRCDATELAKSLPPSIRFECHNELGKTAMRELYYSADVVVNPSLYEGFGLPTLEAMACGVPVIQADNGGLDKITVDGENCVMVPKNDPDKLSLAIENILTGQTDTDALVAGGVKTAASYSLLNQFDSLVSVFGAALKTEFPKEKVADIRASVAHSVDPDGKLVSVRREPLVSVIIPTYNQAAYLPMALDSLIRQTYGNWEAVVINDGSKDNTESVLASYAAKDKRIRYYSQPNGGITAALNAGVKNARGEYFCWLSSDDLYYPEKLEVQLKAFESLNDDYALVYGSFDFLKEETGKIEELGFFAPLKPGTEFAEGIKFDFIDGCSVMIRMSVMRAVGAFNPYFRHAQDFELWVRLASLGYRFHLVDKKVSIRWIHQAQSSTGNMIHCRYDAAAIMDFYINNFRFVEFYRYFDFSKEADRAIIAEHFAARLTHTEANINHPLVMYRFWAWFDSCLEDLPADIQKDLLSRMRAHFKANAASTYKMKYYISECEKALKKTRRFSPSPANFSLVGRDIRYFDRSLSPFSGLLFDYGTDLLVNSDTEKCAQELEFHNTNKVVDTPYKLGHSALRYLSQFANPYQARVKPWAGLNQIPAERLQALEIFCRLRYPDAADAMLATITGSMLAEDAAKSIAAMSPAYKADLKAVCAKRPTDTVLYYWLGIVLEAEGDASGAKKMFRSVDVSGEEAYSVALRKRLGIAVPAVCQKAGCDENLISRLLNVFRKIVK